MTATIAFIGAGNMAGAIIGGLVNQGKAPESLIACDLNVENLTRLHDQFGVKTTQSSQEACAQADLIVLAVKPQGLKQVCLQLSETIKAKSKAPLMVSIAAGIECKSILTWLDATLPLVRVMPNTPALVGTGASGLYANNAVSEPQKQQVEEIFSAIGTAIWVESEAQIHTVTAISGSGPAYFFKFMEAMISAGVKQGLSQEQVTALVQQTALGAAKMVAETGEDPAQLRRNVTAPGGTSEQAIISFENSGITDMVDKAMQACADKSLDLAKAFAD